MASGSSPLTRGKPHFVDLDHEREGLIPAHAGKTRLHYASRAMYRAHPRSRGENSNSGCNTVDQKGSSPLTRGKREPGAPLARSEGLIPAHAGKTVCVCRTASRRTAHPRSRGENASQVRRWLEAKGSSPLTRGKHFLTCAFIAQIDQILESLELCAFSESYSSQDVYATDAPRDRVRSIGLAPRSSRGAS